MKSDATQTAWLALLCALFGLALSNACATIAGLDDDYAVGAGAGTHHAGGAGNAAAAGGAGATSTGSGLTGGSVAIGGFGSGGDSCATGFECLPVPGGGTAALVGVDGSCPADWAAESTPVEGDDPGCSACSGCGSPSGSCGTITVDRYREGNCATHQDGPFTLSADQCVDVDLSMDEQAQGYRVDISVDQGSCSPTSPSSNPNPLAFTRLCELSASPQGSCAGLCVPEVTGAPGADLCVLLPGHTSCPSGFSQVTELYRSFTDNRSCGCGCSAASGGTCTGTLNLWHDADCTGGPATKSIGGCIDASGNTGHDGFDVTGISFTPGSCQPVADPGSVDFAEPITLCCP